MSLILAETNPEALSLIVSLASKPLAFALVVGIGVFGPAIGIGLIGNAAVQSIGRNPDAENKIRSSAILFIAFAEALAIFALVIGFIIFFS